MKDLDVKDLVAAKRLAKKAAAQAKADAAERRHAEADRVWRLADAAAVGMSRQIAASQAAVDSNGVILAWIHPTAGRLTRRQVENIQAKVQCCWEDREQTGAVMLDARIELDGATRGLEEWLANKAYWDKQAASRALESPKQRALRDARKLLDEAGQ